MFYFPGTVVMFCCVATKLQNTGVHKSLTKPKTQEDNSNHSNIKPSMFTNHQLEWTCQNTVDISHHIWFGDPQMSSL